MNPNGPVLRIRNNPPATRPCSRHANGLSIRVTGGTDRPLSGYQGQLVAGRAPYGAAGVRVSGNCCANEASESFLIAHHNAPPTTGSMITVRLTVSVGAVTNVVFDSLPRLVARLSTCELVKVLSTVSMSESAFSALVILHGLVRMCSPSIVLRTARTRLSWRSTRPVSLSESWRAYSSASVPLTWLTPCGKTWPKLFSVSGSVTETPPSALTTEATWLKSIRT